MRSRSNRTSGSAGSADDPKSAPAAIWVVVVNYNGADDTNECLESLAQAGVDGGHMVVVDNASSNGDADRIEDAFPHVRLLRNPENQGWAGGNNRGIEIAIEGGADWVLLLNNDTVVSPHIIDKLLDATREGEWGVVGPVINEYADRDVIQTEGVCFNPTDRNEFFSRSKVVGVSEGECDVVETDIVNGCAVAISREVFERIGLVDERFFLICEESDFCLRAKEAGFRAGVLAEPLVWHKHSASFTRAGKPLQRYYGVRNLGLLLSKHPYANGRRGRWASWLAYVHWTYHVFCHERELRNNPGAEAVVDGLVDFCLRRFGKQRRPLKLLRWIGYACLSGLWRLRGGRITETQGLASST